MAAESNKRSAEEGGLEEETSVFPLSKEAKTKGWEYGGSSHVANFSGPVCGIMDSILDHIGYTPLVRINTITKAEGIECELLAKCEFFNSGGSTKDRIGKRMVLDAEKQGRIKKGDTLIEPTSGNTGIGLALTAALRGYKMIITLPEKMSSEKVNVLKGFGAEIIRTPTEAAFDSPESHIGVANSLNKKLNKDRPGSSHILDQYNNPSNPLAHYDGTAEEILKQCGGKLDMFVAGAGTGGTITGIAQKLREKCPDCVIVGIDPHGSILAQPDSLNGAVSSYHVEGIGYDFIPKVLNRKLVHHWIKSNDIDSFKMSRRLIREEGLLCGGSCGTAMWGAITAIKKFGMNQKGKRVVVILPDSVRNYMSKFLADDWMVANKFKEPDSANVAQHWWASHKVGQLDLSPPVTVVPSVTCAEATSIFSKTGFDQLPVVSCEGDGVVIGVVSVGNLSAKMMSGRVKGTSPISEVVFKKFASVGMETTLGELSILFNTNHYALVTTEQKCYTNDEDSTAKQVVSGIVTRLDLLSYITNKQ